MFKFKFKKNNSNNAALAEQVARTERVVHQLDSVNAAMFKSLETMTKKEVTAKRS